MRGKAIVVARAEKKTLLRRDRKIAAAKERETYVGEEKKGTFGKM